MHSCSCTQSYLVLVIYLLLVLSNICLCSATPASLQHWRRGICPRSLLFFFTGAEGHLSAPAPTVPLLHYSLCWMLLPLLFSAVADDAVLAAAAPHASAPLLLLTSAALMVEEALLSDDVPQCILLL
mmetsp:Transcript_1650/g.3868  ORF Transcript_1650/g.3868 Transcript_1650/m.3868 type:complete len:127 (+) Transcript_1650:633-1013(+)